MLVDRRKYLLISGFNAMQDKTALDWIDWRPYFTDAESPASHEARVFLEDGGYHDRFV